MNHFRKRHVFNFSILFISLVLAPSNAYTGNSASATAFARALVVQSIQINKSRDLDFGLSYSGDNANSIAADGTKGAGFTVSGTANQAYSIILPSRVVMTTGDGKDSENQILVSQFKTSKVMGQIGPKGSDTFHVGATRAAILEGQDSGDYAGSFTITVSYQ